VEDGSSEDLATGKMREIQMHSIVVRESADGRRDCDASGSMAVPHVSEQIHANSTTCKSQQSLFLAGAVVLLAVTLFCIFPSSSPLGTMLTMTLTDSYRTLVSIKCAVVEIVLATGSIGRQREMMEAP